MSDLPEWCVTTPSNALRAMAAQEYPAIEVPLLGHQGVYWTDLIQAAEAREAKAVKPQSLAREQYETAWRIKEGLR